jgi:pimeloyl-ACP methyl ester carboxylesterase
MHLVPRTGLLVLVFLLLPSHGVLATHKVAHCQPLPGHAAFPPDFPVLQDQEWRFRIGGWGGIAKAYPLQHRPVIFVHGNTRDATDWDEPGLSVKQRFLEAGYSLQELWALSYNGQATKGYPFPLQCRTDNTSNIADLTAFVKAGLSYTGATKVDIVAHSLGVTLVRSMLDRDPELSEAIHKFVAIAGPNHGTTVCRRAWLVWLIGWQEFVGCNEIAPGSSWLKSLNRSHDTREVPETIGSLSLYDGTGADAFYRQWLFGWPVWDHHSPALKGATNMTLPGLTHDALRTDPEVVTIYLNYLLPTP